MHGCHRACFPVVVFFNFSNIFLFSCFFTVFYCLSCCFFVVFFQVKILNFQLFSYTGFLRVLENLENLEKATNFIRDKSGIFFILKAVCIYFLSFLRMINFFLAYFLYVYLIEKGCFNALFYLYKLLWITASCD